MTQFQTLSGLWVDTREVVAWDGGGDGKANRIASAEYRGPVADWSAVSKFRDYTSFLNAIKIPWVFPCVSVIAYNFAKTRLALLDEDEEPDDSPDDPLLQLLAKPNPIQSGFLFREMLSMYLELTGNAYITLEERDQNGRPRQLYLPNPARMRIKPGPNGVEGYVYDAGASRSGSGSLSQMIPYDPDEVIHIKFANPLDDYYGMGNVEASTMLMDIVAAMAQQELAYWQSGGRITGVLETDQRISDDDFKRLKREWQLSSADKRQRVRTAILEQGLKYTPIAEGFRSLDLVNIDKGKRDQMLGVFGVPLPKLGIMEMAQYKMDEADAFFWQETMDPKFTRFEDSIQTLVELFHDDRSLQHERKTFEDDQYKIQNANALTGSGLAMVDEGRVMVGLDPLPNGAGQIILINSAYTPVHVGDLGLLADQAVAPPEPAPSPSTEPASPSSGSTGGVGSGGGDGGDNVIHLADHLTAEEKAYVAALEARRKAARAVTVGYKDGKPVTSPLQRLAVASKRVGQVGAMPKPPTRTSSRHPVIAQAIRRHFNSTVSRLTENGAPKVRHAFEEQRTALTRRTQSFRAALSLDTPAKRRAALEKLWDPTPMRDAVAALIVAAAPEAGSFAAKLVPAANSPKAKRIREIKALGVEDIRYGFPLPPEVEAQFPRLGQYINRQWQSIDETTFDGIVNAVETGIQRGYSPLQIANGFAEEEYAGIAGVFDDAIPYRTEMIARTESAFAYNWAAAQTYNEAGVTQVEAIDGIDDPTCADRNGSIFDMSADGDIEDGEQPATDHPNGTLTWVPVVESISRSFLAEAPPEAEEA